MSTFEPHHQFQRDACSTIGKPILNVACMHDPAYLGRDFDAINTDVRTWDAHNSIDLTKLPNFYLCDCRSMPFPDHSFRTVVIGEYLEHCTFEAAQASLGEGKRVMADDGRMVLTFPLDDRPKEKQHDADLLVEWAPGISSWHQTVWTDELLERLFEAIGLKVEAKHRLQYGFSRGKDGYGLVLSKRGS